MKICLNMIVKNESGRIERALRSVAPFITSWVIVDTGSTDDTKQKIVGFFKCHEIPGEIRDAPFEDWSQARNAGLAWARKLAFAYEPDYFLLMDADMELRVHDQDKFFSYKGQIYEMYQQAGSVVYTNSRLISVQSHGIYLGVTHEYFDQRPDMVIGRDVADFYDHADGANRPEKFKRDIRLLKKGLHDEPNNARYMFYLANSYRDAGKPLDAIKWYERRIAAGGWDEEVWQAQVYKSHCYSQCNQPEKFIAGLWEAYALRPTRSEPLYDLTKYYREKDRMQAAALAAAEAGVNIPLSTDKLFVNEFVYEAGFKDEIAICGFYVPGKYMVGYKAASEQALTPKYGNSREAARTHLYHYVKPLREFCPSFKWKHIQCDPPGEGWVCMNPSVCAWKTALYVNVRCVNYRISAAGQYMAWDGEKFNTGEAAYWDNNPIKTRNFLCYLGADPLSDVKPNPIMEVLPPSDLPCEYKLVLGFEDVRLIPTNESLFCSATVRQIQADGNCEQVLSKIEPIRSHKHEAMHTGVHRMLRQPRGTEKNWAPILGDGHNFEFMWRPGETVGHYGSTIKKHDTGLATDHISGSSQLINWDDEDWLAITHEARSIPGSHLRWYMHRFIVYDRDFKVKKISLPFVFHDKVIEFCAGMCWHPNGQDLVVSYGYKDEEARISTVSAEDVEKFIWNVS